MSAYLAAAPSRPRRWRPEQLRAELEAFVGSREDWPTYTEMAAAGREDLCYALKTYGGAPYWAKMLGKRLGRGQDRTPYGEGEALTDARAIVAERGYLPGPKKLRSMGHPRLATYLAVHAGGLKRFAFQHLFPTAPPLD